MSEKSTVKDANPADKRVKPPYMQNRELSWLTFDERCLDQGADPSVPLIERMHFVSIFSSNLQEFFMVRVGSLTDLNLLKKDVLDSKSMMSAQEQLDAIYARCHELYPKQERIYQDIKNQLAQNGLKQLAYNELSQEQLNFLDKYLNMNVLPFLSPQIINSRHPFPHLQNGDIYVIVRLDEQTKPKSEMTKEEKVAHKEAKKQVKMMGADGVTMGLIPMPAQAKRLIKLPGSGSQYILLEDAIEAYAQSVFSMYKVKHTNVICVTRNADIDTTEGAEDSEVDYRAFMKKILKKRGRLAPVRLECKSKLSPVMEEFLLQHLGLQAHQIFYTSVPFNLGFVFGLDSMVENAEEKGLVSPAFAPAWPSYLNPEKSMIEQVCQKEVMLAYPYESMDAFVKLLQECADDPDVLSIKITLYRLASQSRLAEALIRAAENGKEVTALFELRARFDETNNINWSQRFEEAGANVLYGFHEYKTHSKICTITRQTPEGVQYITQLGTGNYNEKTSRLYTDLSFITTHPAIGRDAAAFFKNMGLENLSDEYTTLAVAPLQIKQKTMEFIDEQIALAKEGKPCGVFFKTNAVTDTDLIEKIVEASQAGVPVDMFVRGISCIVPGVPGYTDNVRVVSIVGRLLEHSRIYGFGPADDRKYYLSSADLMTRNMDKRVEIAWPVTTHGLKDYLDDYIALSLKDTAKLRELKSDGSYTEIGHFIPEGAEPFNSQEHFIQLAKDKLAKAQTKWAKEQRAYITIPMAAPTADMEEVVSEPEVSAPAPVAEPVPAPAAAIPPEILAEIEAMGAHAKLAETPAAEPVEEAAPKPAPAVEEPAAEEPAPAAPVLDIPEIEAPAKPAPEPEPEPKTPVTEIPEPLYGQPTPKKQKSGIAAFFSRLFG